MTFLFSVKGNLKTIKIPRDCFERALAIHQQLIAATLQAQGLSRQSYVQGARWQESSQVQVHPSPAESDESDVA